jgi:hypothetical protein
LSRRGRKRKHGSREANGRLRRGTILQRDLVVERQKLRGIFAVALPQGATDPRARYELGRANMLRLIGDDEFEAGLALKKDWFYLYPQKTAPSCLGNLVPSQLEEVTRLPLPEDCGMPQKRCGQCETCAQIKAKERVDAAERLARAASQGGWLMLKAIVLNNQMPDWCDMRKGRLDWDWVRHERMRQGTRRAFAALLRVYRQGIEPGYVVDCLREAVEGYNLRLARLFPTQ